MNAHTDPLFHHYKILKFQDLVDLNQKTFMHKFIRGNLPSSFDNMFNKLVNFERSLCLRVVGLKKTSLKTFPSYILPKAWKNLELELKRKLSLKSFKMKIQESMLMNYDTTCSVQNCFSCKK